MHVEEYGLIEKSGVQMGVGSTKSGLGVLLYASCDGVEIEVVASDKYKVLATAMPEEILKALDEGANISEVLSEKEEDMAFVALNLEDKSSVIGRKKNGKVEIWRSNEFDGFGHMLSSMGDFDPVVMDWYDGFSSFSSKLWDTLKGYDELVIDIEGGVRRFKK